MKNIVIIILSLTFVSSVVLGQQTQVDTKAFEHYRDNTSGTMQANEKMKKACNTVIALAKGQSVSQEDQQQCLGVLTGFRTTLQKRGSDTTHVDAGIALLKGGQSGPSVDRTKGVPGSAGHTTVYKDVVPNTGGGITRRYQTKDKLMPETDGTDGGMFIPENALEAQANIAYGHNASIIGDMLMAARKVYLDEPVTEKERKSVESYLAAFRITVLNDGRTQLARTCLVVLEKLKLPMVPPSTTHVVDRRSPSDPVPALAPPGPPKAPSSAPAVAPTVPGDGRPKRFDKDPKK